MATATSARTDAGRTDRKVIWTRRAKVRAGALQLGVQHSAATTWHCVSIDAAHRTTYGWSHYVDAKKGDAEAAPTL